MNKVRWFVIFAIALAAVSGVLALGGSWLPAIYWAVMCLAMLKLDGLDGA